ncbi:uncharacterized protein LTR77_008283 [Saxophila tyrrhenica]|uniref:Spindle pole body component n=1 Tax=Saxophila tyrrhenica TaxID=1690608 RepID=A0AAV9P6C8_9PEZI|nr:hypothetical protein LTR77_008283 [Saxophila tyrrhenica]
MAHAATISRLTDDLVRSIVPAANDDDNAHNQIRDSAVKQLRTANRARTNQFEVQSKLSGLVEKFAVLNRDDLSEALQSRLDALPEDARWLPEILSLLLNLSDRPLERTRLGDVEASTQSFAGEAETLTWEDLLDDDANDDGDLWADVDRGYHSSGDDLTGDEEIDSDLTTSTQATSVVEEDVVTRARSFVQPLEEDALDSVETLHHEIKDALDSGSSISELTLVRETLSMVHGLLTNLYNMDDRSGQVAPKPHLKLATAAISTLDDATTSFAEIGSSINVLRQWVRKEQPVAYIQSCQGSMQKLISGFDRQLASIEQAYVQQAEDVVVSLLSVRARVERCLRPLMCLAEVVKASENSTISPFALLEGLYDQACTAELSGDQDTFASLLPVLLTGLKTYLRPVSRWITSGTCRATDPSSLVEDRDPDCDPGRFWHDRYAMRSLADGLPYMPAFLRPRAGRVFALGKNQAFLRVLRTEHDDDCESDMNTGTPDFASLEHYAHGHSFLPFSQLLDETLDTWLAATSKDSTPILRRALLEDHGLLKTYSSLTSTFCSANGRAFQEFAETLFWSLDHKPKQWKNEFLLTELANNTLGISNITADMPLTVRVDDKSNDGNLVQSSMQQLQFLTLETVFPWPVQNITRSRSPQIYSKAFALLLQTYRAKSLLRNQFLDLRTAAAQGSSISTTTALALGIRYRLTTIIDVLQAHITTTASTLNASLIHETQAAEDIDAMADVWSKHDKLLETSLLLGEKLRPLRQAVVGLLEVCERFDDLWKTLVDFTASAEDDGAEDAEAPSLESFTAALDETSRLLSFLTAGLRSISRAGGNAAVEMLAERLEWITR